MFMRKVFILFALFFATLAKLWGPGGARAVVAENLLLKQQLLVLERSCPMYAMFTVLLTLLFTLFPCLTDAHLVRSAGRQSVGASWIETRGDLTGWNYQV